MSFFCDTCEEEIKKVTYYQSVDGKVLSPHGDDNDKYTVYFCDPVCSSKWKDDFGLLVNNDKTHKSLRST